MDKGIDLIPLIDLSLTIFGNNIKHSSEGNVPNERTIIIYDPETKAPIHGYLRTTLLNSNGAYLMQGDEDVLIAFLKYTIDRPLKARHIDIPSINTMLNILGLSRNGKAYNKFLDSCRRLKSIMIETNVWKDNLTGKYGTLFFALFDEIFVGGRSILDSEIISHSNGMYIKWSSPIWMSILQKRYKYIDMDVYRKLKNPGARKLYRVVDKRMYQKESASIPLDYLGGNILNLTNSRGADWYYKKFISKYADILVKNNCIKGYKFEKTDGKINVRFFKAEKESSQDLQLFQIVR